MLKRMLILTPLFLLTALFLYVGQPMLTTPVAASPVGDCDSFGTDDPSSTPVEISFTCAEATTAYFGICDSGPALDDYFNIQFNGAVVASNDISGENEIVNIGAAATVAGENTAFLIRTAGGGTATYSYGISTDATAVESYLVANCGGDFTPPSSNPVQQSTCNGVVAVFTQDKAPGNGTLEFHQLFGNEGAFEDELVMKTWTLTEGEQINNATVSNLSSPRYARVWWIPDGSSERYLLTSQYWSNSGTLTSEYGIACGSAQPTYHTSFENGVPESEVCFNPKKGCN